MLYFWIQNRDDDFVFGLYSDYPRIILLLAEAIQGFFVQILTSEFHGRRNTWKFLRLILFAPHIGNDVLYVTRINEEPYFVWQAQYLVNFKVMRINDMLYFAQQSQHFVRFWGIVGLQNIIFSDIISFPRSNREGLRSSGYEITILS